MPIVCADKQSCDKRFDSVYDETFSEIRRYVASKCADPSVLSDVLQEIYMEYYRILLRHGEDYVEDERDLLYKIDSRKVMRYYSFKQRMRKILPLSREEEDNMEYNSLLVDPVNIEEQFVASDEAQEIRRLLSRYPAETRKIIYLYYGEEMKLSEIAEAMQMKLSSVKNRLYRTVNEIREKMEKTTGEKRYEIL